MARREPNERVVICEPFERRNGHPWPPLAFHRGSNLTLCLFGSFRIVFSLFSFLDDFARRLVFRRAGFIGQPRGFAFGGAHIPRGNERLPGGPRSAAPWSIWAVKARNLSSLAFFAASAVFRRSSKLAF